MKLEKNCSVKPQAFTFYHYTPKYTNILTIKKNNINYYYNIILILNITHYYA